MPGKVLLLGGAGYIGAHVAVELARRSYDVLVVDDFSNSSPAVFPRLERLIGGPVRWLRADVRDEPRLRDILAAERPDAVVHLAARKALGESVQAPLLYYDVNVAGSVSLLKAMAATDTARLVFSSSATVYGAPERCPIRESHPVRTTNPYGETKRVGERMIADLAAADPAFRHVALRYFNPVGAHPSGRIGEHTAQAPTNLMPIVCRVAAGRLPYLPVFGADYPTRDGTGVRDYLHVVDLARAHVDAVAHLLQGGRSATVNLGTGRGHSVLELVRTFEAVTGTTVPYRIVARRPGDVAECYADPGLAREILGWRAERSLARMCEDAWRWQTLNPDGYRDAPAGELRSDGRASTISE